MQFEEVIAKAQQQTYQGDYDMAIFLLSELERQHPDNPEVASLLAEVYILNNQKEEAKGFIELAHNLAPDNSELQRVLSRLYLTEDQVELAFEAASSAVQKDKSNSRNYVSLAAACCKKDEFDKAENFLNIALDLNPENPEARYYKAVIASQLKQYESAIRILKNVLDEYPSLDKCWYLLSVAYKESKKLKLALEAIDKAQKLNPTVSSYYLCKAEILPELKQNDEAIQVLSEYNKRFGANAKSYTLLGFVYYKLGKHKEALNYLNSAIEQDPDYAEAYKHKGRLLTETNELEQAVESYQKLLKFEPKEVAVIVEVGNLYSNMHQNEKAEYYFDQALQVDSNIPRPYVSKGHHFIKNQDLESASIMFKKALELPYKAPGAYVQLAQLKAHEGQFSEALDLLNEAYQYFPRFQNIIMMFSNLAPCAPQDYPFAQSFLGRLHINLASVWDKYNTEELPSDETVKSFAGSVMNVLRSFGILDMPMQRSQIFRGEMLGANCQKCKALFDTKNVIPEVCFGCYKVVLSFANLADCIRYNFYMDKLDPAVPIRRKLMIEGRYSDKGAMKGFYYTRDWEKAHRFYEHLKQFMAENLKYDFGIKVKRGCSEFQDEHPEYNTLDENGNLVMKCPDSWKEIEADFYSRRNYEAFSPKTKYDDLGLTIFDAFVIRNWVRMRRSFGFTDFQLEEATHEKSA